MNWHLEKGPVKNEKNIPQVYILKEDKRFTIKKKKKKLSRNITIKQMF